MAGRSFHPVALVAGLLYLVVGALLLVDRLGLLEVGVTWVWPLLLLGVGAAVLLGGRRPEGEPKADEAADIEREQVRAEHTKNEADDRPLLGSPSADPGRAAPHDEDRSADEDAEPPPPRPAG